MSAPDLSVVVPAYNNGRTLAETIESILNQTGVDFELIIADHSSTDDTRAVMDRFGSDPRVTLLSTPSGGGAPRNWNRVTEAASGNLIKLVCGDDVLLPGVLARQAAILADPKVELTACRRNIVDASGNVLFRDWGLRGLPERTSGRTAVRRAVRAGSNLFGEPASVMMRRRQLIDSGGWLPDFPYLIDQATYSRLLMLGEFAADSSTGATFRVSTTQWSVALTKQQSSQARAFHAWLHEEHPDTVSTTDVRVGNVRASLMSRARRLSYWVLKRRMR